MAETKTGEQEQHDLANFTFAGARRAGGEGSPSLSRLGVAKARLDRLCLSALLQFAPSFNPEGYSHACSLPKSPQYSGFAAPAPCN